MQSEEKNLKAAQEKNKDVPHRQERYDAQKAEYEKFHAQYMTEAEALLNQKAGIFSRSFEIYQFFVLDLLDRKTATVGNFRQQIPYSTMKQELPGVGTKIEVVTVKINVEAPAADE
jgi:hypothetical protein